MLRNTCHQQPQDSRAVGSTRVPPEPGEINRRRRAFMSVLGGAAVIAVGAVAFSPPLRAQGAAQPARVTGLLVVRAEKTVVDGKNGINVTFDEPSAERLRQFTRSATGLRAVFVVNQVKLATLRVLGPILYGKVLLTGDPDNQAAEALLAPGAVVDLQLE
jgi:hypothetical protein